MLDMSQAGKVDIQFALDRPDATFCAGEVSNVAVSIVCGRALQVHQLSISLVCVERFERREESREWKTIEQVWHNVILLRDANILPEVVPTFRASVPIPSDAPPTTAGETIQISWSFQVTLHHEAGEAMHRDYVIRVLSSPSAHPLPEGTLCVDNDLEATAVLNLQRGDLTPGGMIQGELVVEPKRSFRVSSIRLELVTQEKVAGEMGFRVFEQNGVKLTGRRDLKFEKKLVLPFVIDLPVSAPATCRASDCSITWLIRGILDRKLRAYTLAEREILVHNGRVVGSG